MPRKNKNRTHQRIDYSKPQPKKRRFPTQATALAAAELRMLENPGLTLSVYQGEDRGWYLTSRTKTNNIPEE